MTRPLTGPVDTVVASGKQNWALLLELGFDSGVVNVWSGTGELPANGKTWLGLGDMGSISGVTEVTDLTDVVLKATLSHIMTGLMPELVDEVTTQDTTFRPFEFLIVFFDDDRVVIGTVILAVGFIDQIQLAVGADGGGITIDLVTETALLTRSNFVRMTNDAQQNIFPEDLGLQFVTDLDDQIIWGNSGDVSTIGRGGGRSGGGESGAEFRPGFAR